MADNLAAALAAFQNEMPTVRKAHKAEVQTKQGGSYSYTYADLADVTAAAAPLLSKNGLAFTACPRATDRGYELAGVLLHVSGESREGALPLTGNTPQELGSSITYMRRYLLGCITGLVTDDDDDGRLATAAKPAERKATRHKTADDERWQTPPDPLSVARADLAEAAKALDIPIIKVPAMFEQWAAVPFAEADAQAVTDFTQHLRKEGVDA